MEIKIKKNRNRGKYIFANINLIGPCNAKCYFCLGKDILKDKNFTFKNHLNIHFAKWKNFENYLDLCKKNNICKIYLTGQNTDPLLYKYLKELILYLKFKNFKVGMRTNGYLAEEKIDIINLCNEEIGYSIHTLNPKLNKIIMGREDIPNWDFIIPNTNNVRVAILVGKYNSNEFITTIKKLSKYKNIKYFQARRISTETRFDELKEDIQIYENVFNKIDKQFKLKRFFFGAQIYEIYGKEVTFWRTVETSINSMNYFTDGIISDNYFVVEGYLNGKNKETILNN